MDYQLRNGDRTPGSIYRTRGAFNPNAVANAANSNLPVLGDATIGPNSPIVAFDAFTVSSPFSFTSLGGASNVAVVVGDRLVYNGGTITSVASWSAVFEGARAKAGNGMSDYPNNVRVIGESNTAFA
jgi:hypothetical protein